MSKEKRLGNKEIYPKGSGSSYGRANKGIDSLNGRLSDTEATQGIGLPADSCTAIRFDRQPGRINRESPRPQDTDELARAKEYLGGGPGFKGLT